MRIKFRYLGKDRKWQVYDYINKVIDSCRTYQQLITVESWMYNIPDFEDEDLIRKIIAHIHYKEDELMDMKVNREVQ